MSAAPGAGAGRKPLDAASLARAVLRPGGLWQAVEVEKRTGSTNADLLARALGGAPEGVVLAAEEQSAGRGRMGRTWVAPPRAALTFSLLVRPAAAPPARRG
ncbi:MAG TPA: biotin--[acetyl-CoA-carboxylase] ligase, partial [Streptosporangiaceae bacterium]|nr:biotin--[acetyl-CoA-carboxylase] ligase [Streptosporangiaceae bacterium]